MNTWAVAMDAWALAMASAGREVGRLKVGIGFSQEPKWLIAISWMATAAVGVAGVYSRMRRVTEPAAGVFFLTMASVAISILLLTYKTSTAGSVLAVIFLGIPVMGPLAFYTVPAVGYGGQIVIFALKTVAATVVISGLVARAMRKDGYVKVKAMKGFVAANTVTAMIVVFSSGALVPLVQSWFYPSGLSVSQLRVAKGGICRPLVEGDRAIVVGLSGLEVVDLESMRVVHTLALPNPTPEEAGLMGLQPEPLLLHAEGSRVFRSGPDEITVVSVFPTRTPDGVGEAGRWFLWTRIGLGADASPSRSDFRSGQGQGGTLGGPSVLSWEVKEERPPELPAEGYFGEIQVAGARVTLDRDIVWVQARDIIARIWLKGDCSWHFLVDRDGVGDVGSDGGSCDGVNGDGRAEGGVGGDGAVGGADADGFGGGLVVVTTSNGYLYVIRISAIEDR